MDTTSTKPLRTCVSHQTATHFPGASISSCINPKIWCRSHCAAGNFHRTSPSSLSSSAASASCSPCCAPFTASAPAVPAGSARGVPAAPVRAASVQRGCPWSRRMSRGESQRPWHAAASTATAERSQLGWQRRRSSKNVELNSSIHSPTDTSAQRAAPLWQFSVLMPTCSPNS